MCPQDTAQPDSVLDTDSPEQVAHGPQLRIVNIRLGQNVQPLPLHQVKSVVLVVSVLEAVGCKYGADR